MRTSLNDMATLFYRSRHGNYPGTAFTRSFGDFYAKELGVSAEAEIFIRDITKQDKYIIIASDGVFEFLTNQMVIDIAATFTDPLEACNAIVNTAYNMWLQYEVSLSLLLLQLLKRSIN